jgi:hypothetical protein
VVPINAAPSFVKGPDVNVPMNSGAYSASGWATSISPGPNESSQTVDFIVGNNNNNLFSVQPAITPDGILTFTPANGFSGTAFVSVRLHDNGGTACSGTDTSPEQTFYINVVPPFTVTVTAPDSFAQEPDFGVNNNGQFLLTRTGADYSQTLTVSYSVSGSAVSGQDYQTLSGTAIFGVNQTNVPIALIPINDFTWEGDETVIVTLATANGYAVGSPAAATVVIVAILDLGALPSATDSYGFSLNNSGRVTGVSGNRAFATSPNSAISYTSDLHGALATHFGGGSGTTSIAWDITDTGAMAGEFGNGSTTNAWYRTPSGSLQTISAPNSTANYLRAIREWDAGSTGAGFSTVGGYNRFCNWYMYDNNPSSTYVYNIGGLWPSHHSYALGVVSNRIVGYIANYNSGYNQAVLWDWNGSFAYYLNSPGDSQTEAYDIAPYYPNYFTIAGHAANGSVRSACYWVYSAGSASVTKLSNPYNWHSTARGINSGYRVVGSVHPHYDPYPTYQHACIWDSGTFIDLYNLGTASGWSLFSAEKLSTQSQITGYGYINGQMHGYLMTQ